MDIRWISCEECHPFLFHMFLTCIFYMDYWCFHVYSRVYIWWISSEVWALFFSGLIHVAFHVDCWCTFPDVFHVNCFTWINGCTSPRGYQMDIMWRIPPNFVSLVFHVYFSHGSYWCRPTYPRGHIWRKHVMVKPRFTSCVFHVCF